MSAALRLNNFPASYDVGTQLASESNEDLISFLQRRIFEQSSVSIGWQNQLMSEAYAVFQKSATREENAKVSTETFASASRLINLLPENIIKPDLFSDENGEIVFEWNNGMGTILSVAVLKNKLIYAGLSKKAEHGADPDFTILPNLVREYLQDFLVQSK